MQSDDDWAKWLSEDGIGLEDDGFDDLFDNWPTRKVDVHEQERIVRIETLARIYEQADRVITGDPVEVRVEPTGPAPAWSDGKSITFNAEQIEDFDIEELVQLNGLNYHELAHHEYTPRRSSKLVEWVITNNMMMSFNMLEDQRIETLLIGRFPSVIPYLQATVLRWLANSPQEVMLNYPCIRGRRYLPLEIREAFRDNFIIQELVPTIARIVDEYRTLALPDNDARAKELIEQFKTEVLDKLPQQPGSGGPNGCGHRPPVVSGRPTRGKQQVKDLQRSKRYDQKPDDVTGCTPGPSGEKSGDFRMSPEDSVDVRNENAERKEFSLKPGEGHFESTGGIPDDLGKMLKRSIADAMNRKDVQADVKAKQRVILGGDGKHDYQVKVGKYDETSVPSDLVVITRKFQTELEKLRSDSEPAWQRELPSGRLNIPRFINGCEIDQAFDQWDEGNDSTDIETIILVDRSGSMSSRENDRLASQACWVIKRALEAIDAPVTVMAFDDRTELVYGRENLASRRGYKFIYGQGGTDPREALLEAERMFMTSRKKTKILLLITDGVFNNGESDDAIARMASRGVLTSMVLLMPDEGSWISHQIEHDKNLFHGCEIKGKVDSAAMLIPFARALVIGAIKKRAYTG